MQFTPFSAGGKPTRIQYWGPQDGSSPQQAVVIHTPHSIRCVMAQYDWLAAHFGEFGFIQRGIRSVTGVETRIQDYKFEGTEEDFPHVIPRRFADGVLPRGEAPLDFLEIRLPSGEARKIYFDISACWNHR